MEKPNIEYFIKLSRGDEAIKQKFIAIIKYELPFEIEEYLKNVKNNETQKTAESVHKLKHKIGVLGLEKSYYMAEQYENMLVENNKQLQNEFETILKLIQNFVNNL